MHAFWQLTEHYNSKQYAKSLTITYTSHPLCGIDTICDSSSCVPSSMTRALSPCSSPSELRSQDRRAGPFSPAHPCLQGGPARTIAPCRDPTRDAAGTAGCGPPRTALSTDAAHRLGAEGPRGAVGPGADRAFTVSTRPCQEMEPVKPCRESDGPRQSLTGRALGAFWGGRAPGASSGFVGLYRREGWGVGWGRRGRCRGHHSRIARAGEGIRGGGEGFVMV